MVLYAVVALPLLIVTRMLCCPNGSDRIIGDHRDGDLILRVFTLSFGTNLRRRLFLVRDRGEANTLSSKLKNAEDHCGFVFSDHSNYARSGANVVVAERAAPPAPSSSSTAVRWRALSRSISSEKAVTDIRNLSIGLSRVHSVSVR